MTTSPHAADWEHAPCMEAAARGDAANTRRLEGSRPHTSRAAHLGTWNSPAQMPLRAACAASSAGM